MILSWDKPKKLQTHEKWASVTADGAPPGVYVPNMSKADGEKWKAKLVGGKNTRVEIRKSVKGTQILIIVSLTGTPIQERHWRNINVVMSMNGKSTLTFEEMDQLYQGVQEARKVLEEVADASK